MFTMQLLVWVGDWLAKDPLSLLPCLSFKAGNPPTAQMSQGHFLPFLFCQGLWLILSLWYIVTSVATCIALSGADPCIALHCLQEGEVDLLGFFFSISHLSGFWEVGSDNDLPPHDALYQPAAICPRDVNTGSWWPAPTKMSIRQFQLVSFQVPPAHHHFWGEWKGEAESQGSFQIFNSKMGSKGGEGGLEKTLRPWTSRL